jgi:glycogen debranching enzyme
MSFGRHMGTVWPQIQGFWAEAAARADKPDVFAHEFFNLANHAVRDKQFVEIYHPDTGMPYGGLQEQQGKGVVLWEATSRQPWAATAYLRMVLLGLVGMRFDTDGVRFEPCVPSGISTVDLRNVRYRKMSISVTIRGTGTRVRQCLINGKDAGDHRLPAGAEGPQDVVIVLGGG